MTTIPSVLEEEYSHGRPATVCQQVFDSMAIHANGDIVCWCVDVFGKRVYGNVFRDRIEDVFNGPLYQETRELLARSGSGTFCQALCQDCGFKNVPVTEKHFSQVHHVKTIRLEATTFCNLECPACPTVTVFDENPTRYQQMLSLEAMIDIVEQLPHLQIIEYFDYGEPFLNKHTIEFLRHVRRTRPDVFVATNTNGTVLTPKQIDAIANEALVARILFSIDGATPESYRKYRIGGSYEKAFAKMLALTEACRSAGTWRQYYAEHGAVQVVWQYILFEWNDSEEEIALAQKLAADAGLPLTWIMTASEGASKRVTPGSKAAAALFDPPRSFITCVLGLDDEEAPREEIQNDQDAPQEESQIVIQPKPASSWGSKIRMVVDLIRTGQFWEIATKMSQYVRAKREAVQDYLSFNMSK